MMQRTDGSTASDKDRGIKRCGQSFTSCFSLETDKTTRTLIFQVHVNWPAINVSYHYQVVRDQNKFNLQRTKEDSHTTVHISKYYVVTAVDQHVILKCT